MKNKLIKALLALLVLSLGIFLGRTVLKAKSTDTVPMPATMSYRNTGKSNNTLPRNNVAVFNGNIIAHTDIDGRICNFT